VEELKGFSAKNAAVGLAVVVVSLLLSELPAVGAKAQERPVGVVDLHVDLSYQINYKGQGLSRGSNQYSAANLLSSGAWRISKARIKR
jgi:hypothetical protein